MYWFKAIFSNLKIPHLQLWQFFILMCIINYLPIQNLVIERQCLCIRANAARTKATIVRDRAKVGVLSSHVRRWMQRYAHPVHACPLLHINPYSRQLIATFRT